MSLEQIIIFYLIIAVWWNTNKWMKANKTIKGLKLERDKYKEAWTNSTNIIVWGKNEKSAKNK